MPVSLADQSESSVVHLALFRDVAGQDVQRSNIDAVRSHQSAHIIDLHAALHQVGCVFIDTAPDSTYPVDSLWHNVRHNLDAEFGPQRVQVKNGEFIVRHRGFEELVAGLLRVQYNALQFHKGRDGASLRRRSDAVASLYEQGVVLSWGAGSSLAEARAERRRRSRRYRAWR